MTMYDLNGKPLCEDCLRLRRELEAARAEIERIKTLYAEWGFKDAPCPKHSKEPLLADYCASCDAEQLRAEVEWYKNRDLRAHIELCFDDGVNPFAREDLKVLDVGVADNCYVVESETVTKLRVDLAAAVEVLRQYADPNNWGYYDDSGCEKGRGKVEDACFIGPGEARALLARMEVKP